MWDRRSFWLSLLSAPLLTVAALYGIMLELWSAESFAAYWFGEGADHLFGQPQSGLWFSPGLRQLDVELRFWAAATAPGIVLYPLCWYAAIWRRRDYSVRRTWFLIGVSFTLCCVVSIIMLFNVMFEYAIGPGNGAPIVPSVVSGASMPIIVLASVGTLASYAVMLACFISLPFFLVAAPLAFLHRAMLMAIACKATAAAKKTPRRRTISKC